MAITNFIPTIWSENLITALDKQYVGVANCNRDYEGDIKGKGSVVKICGVGSIAIGDYTKNTDLSSPQTLEDTVKTLITDQAKCFNFQIDDIDRAQSSPKLMDAAMSNAASALAKQADKYVYSLVDYAGTSIYADGVSENDILDNIIKARQKLYENDVSDAHEVSIEVSPAIASLILKAKIATATDNTDALGSGCLGAIGGCKVYVTNNIQLIEEEDMTYHQCLVRTKRAIAFAEQISEIDAYRPEKRFADAVKGLHLYGASVVYPNELVAMNLGILK